MCQPSTRRTFFIASQRIRHTFFFAQQTNDHEGFAWQQGANVALRQVVRTDHSLLATQRLVNAKTSFDKQLENTNQFICVCLVGLSSFCKAVFIFSADF